MSDPNENRSGYKDTKAGWIPEDWDAVPIGMIATKFRAGVSVNSGDRPAENGDPGVLKTSCVSTGRFRRSENKAVVPDEINRVAAPVSANSVIISRMNTVALVGANAFVSEDHPSLFLPDRLWQTTVSNSDYDHPRWFGYAMESRPTRYRISSLATGTSGSMKNVTQADVRSVYLARPSPQEQKKIATILSSCDEVIEKTSDLLDANKRQKKALLQQLLTSKKRLPRFEMEWHEVAVEDLVKPVSAPVPKPNEPYVAVGIRSHGKGTFHRNVEDPAKVAMDTLYRVEPGDLVVNITFAWEGAIALVQERDAVGYVSHRFPTFRPRSSADIGFLKYLVISQRFIWDLGLVSPGGAGRNRVMNKKDFLKIKLFVPYKEEQQAVASILMASDAELEVLESKIEALKQQKKSLMQKLLTGQVRVKV